MKGNIVLRTVMLLFIILLMTTATVTGQNAPAEPLVYEDIDFPDLPYASRWIEINGAKMHYMETGDPAGPPILLLHGNPTWSYLWRNIMPHLETSGWIIAVDMIGMGKSDKPDIGYTFVEHRDYLWRFIELTRLEDIVLVVHDWGGGLGFDYARNHPENVRGIVMMETLLRPFPGFDQLPGEGPAAMMQMIRSTDGSAEAVMLGQNMFVEQFLSSAVLRQLSEEEKNAYRAPYPTPETRTPLLVWPRQIPIGGEPAEVHEIVAAYAQWLTENEIPKLLLYAEPGMMLPAMVVDADTLKAQYKNMETASIGEGLHFIQEDQPDAIGMAIADWLERAVYTD